MCSKREEMPKPPALPELPPSGERPAYVDELLVIITQLSERVARQAEMIQTLRDEIATLKKQKPKPKIGPSRLNKRERKKRERRDKKAKAQARELDEPVIVKPENVPDGSRFKGYAEYTVQELIINTKRTLYRIEKWLTPEGKIVTEKLPPEASVGHFGSVFQSFAQYQYDHEQNPCPYRDRRRIARFGARVGDSSAIDHHERRCGPV